MDAVLAVRRLGVGPVERVRRPWHVAVRGSLVRLPGAPATQRLVGMVELAPPGRQALVSRVVERAVGLCAPELVLLGDQLLDLIQDGLLFHRPSITRAWRSAARPAERLSSDALGRPPIAGCPSMHQAPSTWSSISSTSRMRPSFSPQRR